MRVESVAESPLSEFSALLARHECASTAASSSSSSALSASVFSTSVSVTLGRLWEARPVTFYEGVAAARAEPVRFLRDDDRAAGADAATEVDPASDFSAAGDGAAVVILVV